MRKTSPGSSGVETNDSEDLWRRSDFPYFASIGNHDCLASLPGCSGPGNWPDDQALLQARLDRIPGASCTSDLGVNAACTYMGISFILSGVGTSGTDHETFITDALSATDSDWRICSWHKVHELMQVGPHLLCLCWMIGAGLLVGCGESDVRARRPNLILITLDTFRADVMNAYGGREGTTPCAELLRLAIEFHDLSAVLGPITEFDPESETSRPFWDLINEEGQPTILAPDEILGFLAQRLGTRAKDIAGA